MNLLLADHQWEKDHFKLRNIFQAMRTLGDLWTQLDRHQNTPSMTPLRTIPYHMDGVNTTKLTFNPRTPHLMQKRSQPRTQVGANLCDYMCAVPLETGTNVCKHTLSFRQRGDMYSAEIVQLGPKTSDTCEQRLGCKRVRVHPRDMDKVEAMWKPRALQSCLQRSKAMNQYLPSPVHL